MFGFKSETAAELRGLPDQDLQRLSDNALTMLAMAVLMGAVGVADDPLIHELSRRAGAEYKP